MKRIGFLAMMMLMISINVYSQVRLSSRDTSTVNDANFAVQENGRWRQLPYSVLKDSIYSQEEDKDPTGAVMAQKIAERNGLVPRYFGIADSANLYSKGLNIPKTASFSNSAPFDFLKNTRIDSSFIRFYGPHGYSQIYGGINARYGIANNEYARELNYTVNTSSSDASMSYYYKAHGDKIDYTGASYTYFPVDYLLQQDVVAVGTPDDWEHKTFRREIRSSRDSIYSPTHKSNYISFLTTLNGTTNPVSTFEITEREGKLWALSLQNADYIKLNNGVLEGKTAIQTLNDLGSSAPVYQDNATATAAIGTGKVFKDNSGYLRVTQ